MSHSLSSSFAESLKNFPYGHLLRVLPSSSHFLTFFTGRPSSLKREPLFSTIEIILHPSSSERHFAAWYPTLPRPWTITVFPSRPVSIFFVSRSFLSSKNSRRPNWTPLPVASFLPAIPFLWRGFPVTHALPLISLGCNFWYSSAIHAISLSEVPKSGAGTFWLGLIRSLLMSSCANLLVILAISPRSYFLGSIFKAPLEPENGTSTIAHL